MRSPMLYVFIVIALAMIGTLGWNMTARAGYESAEYQVVLADGKIEIRVYPDLTLASVETSADLQGRDGSFMKLFRYISGANAADQKIAMTTPVFMEDNGATATRTMGFVVPKDIASSGTPAPKSSEVKIRKREGGRFAVIRFSGRLDPSLAEANEKKLREWMKANELSGSEVAEAASYDPPFTPGPLRRNEVLIRLVEEQSDNASLNGAAIESDGN